MEISLSFVGLQERTELASIIIMLEKKMDNLPRERSALFKLEEKKKESCAYLTEAG